VLADDPERETRQLGVVAADGRAAAHTGAECLAWAGHRVGDGYAVQGNILAGEVVVTEMERAFLETSGSLAERLVASLEAGQAAGGDSRGQQSAAIVVERVGAAQESRERIDRVCELRVEDHPEPIAELRRLLGIHLVWAALRRASAFHAPGRYAEGVAVLREAAERQGDHPVLLYDLACYESLAGEPEEALAHLERAVALDAGLRAGAAADSDFDAIRQDPRFAGLVS
jgi:tetratricopeptide (TPR) repeat protein